MHAQLGHAVALVPVCDALAWRGGPQHAEVINAERQHQQRDQIAPRIHAALRVDDSKVLPGLLSRHEPHDAR